MSEKTDYLTLNSDTNLQSSSTQIEQIPKIKSKVKLIEKSSQKKKEFNFEVSPKIENKEERKDAKGEIINHKNKKKVKITFRDNLYPEQGLADIIDIESIKAFNYIPSENGYSDMYRVNKQKKCCCFIY